MKNIKQFNYFKSFYAVEYENKEFSIITERAFLPADGATYNLSVISNIAAPVFEDGWILTLHFLCGERHLTIGVWRGAKADLAEFLTRANALIEATHTPLPPP